MFGFLKNAVKKIGNTIGRGIEKIGEVIHSTKIEDAGFRLQSACDFGYTSWSESSSVSRTVDVHKELNKVTQSIRPSASAAEAELIELLNSEIGNIMEGFMELTPCPDLTRLNENYTTDIQAQLSGRLMKFIQPRLSLDDKECKDILEIYDDSERKQKADNFKAKVLADAEKKFKTLCSDIKKEYCEKMLNISDGVLNAVQIETKKQKDLLQQLLAEVTDEQTIDFEREIALITSERLSILNAIAFDS